MRSTFKFVTGFFLILAVLASLTLNATMLLWNTGAATISAAIFAMTGVQTVLQQTFEKLDTKNKELKKLNSKLAEFETDRKKNPSKAKSIREKVGKRVTRMATVNVAAVPLEFIPFVGAGIVVGVTAWELREYCELLKELKELDETVGFQQGAASTNSEINEVCGMKVPSVADALKMSQKGFLKNYNTLVKEGVESLPNWDTIVSALNEYFWQWPKKFLGRLFGG